jgi:hypothetical protein
VTARRRDRPAPSGMTQRFTIGVRFREEPLENLGRYAKRHEAVECVLTGLVAAEDRYRARPGQRGGPDQDWPLDSVDTATREPSH